MRITSFSYTQLAVKLAFVVPLIDPVNAMKLDRSSKFVITLSMLTAPERGERWIVNPAAIYKMVLLTFVMALHLFQKFTVSLWCLKIYAVASPPGYRIGTRPTHRQHTAPYLAP